jgi:hypothetical protein
VTWSTASSRLSSPTTALKPPCASRHLECPLPIDIHARDLTRYPPEIIAYFVCVEAIQNATKHAGPDAATLIDLNGRHGQCETAMDGQERNLTSGKLRGISSAARMPPMPGVRLVPAVSFPELV